MKDCEERFDLMEWKAKAWGEARERAARRAMYEDGVSPANYERGRVELGERSWMEVCAWERWKAALQGCE